MRPVSFFTPEILTRTLSKGWVLAVGVLLCLPVAVVLGSWLGWNATSADALAQMAQTVLPRYVGATLLLSAGVALGTAAVGLGAAVIVTLFEFRGRRTLAWLLLLPLAMPAYVLAFAYTDALAYSGPVQAALRDALGVQGRVLPEVRSLGGAVVVFVLALYPYVYVLARTALAERAVVLLEAARTMGVPLKYRMLRVALPLARPAVVAGVALALMEALADFGVVSYFGIQTFTAGIYKAWLVLDDRLAAAQLATFLLVLVALLLHVERKAQARLRFAAPTGAAQRTVHPMRVRGGKAWALRGLCALPVLLGFVLPVAFMLRPLWAGDAQTMAEVAAMLPRFGRAAVQSLAWGLGGAGITVALALGLAHAARSSGGRIPKAVLRVAELGYAVPGAVLVVGLLLSLAWLSQFSATASLGAWVTGSALGVMWAYTVRFSAVALQSVQAGYSRVPTSLDDSAKTMGVGGTALLFGVHLPLLKRSVLAAALLVFVDVMKELPATLVLRPFNSDTLAVLAYQLAKDERLAEAAVPSLAIVVCGLLPVFLLSRTSRAGA